MASKDNHEGSGQGEPTQGASPDARLDESQVAAARLTAYVLGELETTEREAIERELAASEALRQQVAEIRQSVDLVTVALSAEPMVALAAEQRLRLAETSLAPSGETHQPTCEPANRSARRLRLPTKYMLAAAVLLCVTGGTALLLLPSTKAARRTVSLAEAVNRPHDLPTLQQDLEGVAPEEMMARIDAPATSAKVTPANKGYFEFTSAGVAPGGDAGRYADNRAGHTVARPAYETKTRQGLPFSRFGNTLDEEFARGESRLGAGNVPSEAAPLEGISNTESYDRIYENPFLDVRQNPLSTFSIDVDTASYANVRRFLNGGALPPKDAVRIEELINYFTYHYAPPADDQPFAVHAEVAGCPWEPKHRLLRIALKGREIDLENRPASNLVFLIDVSGSMDDPAKLPLLKSALHMLVDKLGENDRVAMVVYAGSSGLVLPSTSGLYKETILAALDRLQAGGSTNGGSGIQLAYQVAREKFITGGTNRVILCTDGDFNVGVTDQGSLTRLIEEEAKSGVFLSVLGFGAGNLKDSTMEKLADRGNGNYAYIDTLNEARKVLVEELGGTLVTIAKDVKLQLEFNPRRLAAYRLIGYENRLLRAEDFNDDKKDAGEIGAGHTVTALYELVPAGGGASTSKVDELKYQRTGEVAEEAFSDELLTLKLRYKEPDGEKSRLIESVVKETDKGYAQASEDFRFASAVAGFGLLLRDSQYKADLTWPAVLELAQASRGTDENGYRAEFIELLKKAAASGGR
ncbi:MAG TPA: von Willebrand factor type A domain-containing protein [Pirellulales bacterium]|nr:von Willebrand factor type A domain-containing protein [Pirellulales bacterium]